MMNRDLLEDYLVNCYLYYTVGEPIIDDHTFDKNCLEIEATWDALESPYKEFVFTLEKGVIEGIKGSELGDTCPPELIDTAMNRLADHNAERELFQ